MALFWNLVISGVVSGAIYSMMASSLVLTCQTSGVFNFAQGAEAFVVAYCYYQLHTGQGLPVWLAALLSVGVFAPLMAVVFDRILLRRLSEAPVFARVVGTVGLLVAIPALALWIVETICNGIFHLGLPTTSQTVSAGGTVSGIGPTPPSVWHLGFLGLPKVNVSSDQVAVFAAAALAALGLWLVLHHTRIGLEMRATVDRRDLSALRGMSLARTSSVSWVLTMVLVGLGGLLIAPLFQLDQNTFTLVVFGSLPAVALAGLRSIPIAFGAGLLMGVVQDLLAGYGHDFLPSSIIQLSGFRSSLPFLITVVLLFFLGRDRGRQAGSAADEKPRPDHRHGLPSWRRVLPWALVTAGFLAFDAQASSFTAGGILAPGLAVSTILLSFVVVTGIGGMISLAQATFVTAGGFAAGWLAVHHWGLDVPFIFRHGHLNFLLAALSAGVVAAALGALIAVPVRRLGALALALGTFSLALVADLAVFQLDSIRNGDSGYVFGTPKFTVFGATIFNFAHPRQEVIVFLVVFGLVALVIRNLERSSSGRAIFAVRSSQAAAGTSGIIAGRVQISIFALSAGIAGIGGALMGVAGSSFTNTTAPALAGLTWLAAAVTFGVRRPGGAFIAGLSVVGTTQLFDTISGWSWVPHNFGVLTTSSYFPSILFGLGAVNLAMNPDGILALMGEQQAARRRSRRARSGSARDRLTADEATSTTVTTTTVTTTRATDTTAETLTTAEHAPAATAPGQTGPVVAPGAEGRSGPAVLVLDDIVAGYGEVEVLHGVSLSIAKGSIVAIIGANGAGKSTFCAVAAGMVTPTRGRVLINGEDLTSLLPHQRVRHGLVLVPEARGIFPSLSVEENLQVLLRAEEDRARVYDRFRVLGDRRSQIAGSLSGGEQQMLSLAPALVRPPEVFIADEPTLGLAPLVTRQIVEALAELRALGSAIVLVEEKAADVVELADTVAFMELGRLTWIGAPGELTEERMAVAYLGAQDPELEPPSSRYTTTEPAHSPGE